MNKKPIILICTAIAVLSLVYLYFSFNNLIDDYNSLVDKNRDLVKKYNLKLSEVENLKLLMTYNQEHITNLKELIEKLYIRKDTLTIELKEKEKEIQENEEGWINFWNEQIKYNNFTWTGCKDSRTILKFCKGCNWDLVCSMSMRPTFSCENTLYFCSPKKSEIKMGDIIAFSTPEYENEDYETFYTIHRVINITNKGYITKGDNALYPDEFIVPYKNILGKLWKVEG